MTEINPPGFLQNAGTVHTAEIIREVANVLTGGRSLVGGNLQRARGGLHPSLGVAMNVSQTGSPNMSVDVQSGHALVPGTENLKQAMYSCFNDGAVNRTITASDPSLPRIDIVVAKVQDTFYSGVANTWSIVVVTGVAASSPAVPTAPANSLVLAQVAVGAAVTSIVNANITDARPWLAATGGILPVRSKTERDALAGLYDGYTVWRQDANALNISDGAGAWRWFTRPLTASTATNQTTSSLTFTDLATVGPSISLETGAAAKVTITASIQNTALFQARMGFAVSGATTVAANDLNSIFHPQTVQQRLTGTFLVTSLTAGTNVFTAKYRTDSAGVSASFTDRIITVEAC